MKNKTSHFTKKLLSVILAVISLLSVFAATQMSAAAAGYYEIRNVGTGKYLNVAYSSSKSGTNVNIYAKDGTKGEKYRFTANNGGYLITPQCAAKCALNVNGYSAKQGANVNIYSVTKSKTQTWKLYKYGSAFVIACADNTDYVLTATGSANSANVNIQKWTASKNQQWSCDAFSGLKYSTMPTVDRKLQWPVPAKYNITGKYGTNRGDHIHAGIDIGTQGTKNVPIYAVADGEVVAVKTSTSGPRGRYVIVYHKALGITSLYQHCASVNVSVGTKVSRGQKIAVVGGSGYNSNTYYALHCHLELANGKRTTADAVSRYRFDPTPGKVYNYTNK